MVSLEIDYALHTHHMYMYMSKTAISIVIFFTNSSIVYFNSIEFNR